MRTAFGDCVADSGEQWWPGRTTRARLVILLFERGDVESGVCWMCSVTVERVMNRSDLIVRVSE